MDSLEFRNAVASGDAARLRALLSAHPEWKDRLNEPVFAFGTPAILEAAGRNRETLDVLLEFGADVNARSSWWAGSFGVLDLCPLEMAAHLIERGATVDINAAARLGMIDRVRELVAGDPQLVHARGGDGQTPLHVASTVEIAGYLLDHGADIDARDVDHESTPAQYLVAAHPEVARFLIARGCRTDLLLAAAVGDRALVQRILDADPNSIRMRVSGAFFPMQNPHAGGPIYTWTLGKNLSAHQVAMKFGHPEVLGLLAERSPEDVMLVEACMAGEEAAAQAILAQHPDIVRNLTDEARRQIVRAAEDNRTSSVRLMLEAGWPVAIDGVTPLHFAAWHGNREMVRLILAHDPPLEQREPMYQGTPLGWAIHGSENSWYRQKGDYAATVESLLAAGAGLPVGAAGSAAVQGVLNRYRSMARALGAGDEIVPWLARLESAEPAHAMEVPDSAQIAALLEQWEVAPEDAAEVLRTMPHPDDTPAAWWALERARCLLARGLANLDDNFVPPPALPAPLDLFPAHLVLVTAEAILQCHREFGIPDDVSRETLSFLGRALRARGEAANLISGWGWLRFTGRLYQVGRLEVTPYRIRTYPKEAGPLFWYDDADAERMGRGFRRGDAALGLHIPSGEPLAPEACDRSLARMSAAFAGRYPGERPRIATCTSWLMDDELAGFLPADSNILSFQRRFHLAPGATEPRQVQMGRPWRLRTGWLEFA